ncbi:MAG TPA: hypothetical protein VER11_00230 [Polyangiaceae bacterium]|nr:hypothetical protein [Polyangiaceae bacterium]
MTTTGIETIEREGVPYALIISSQATSDAKYNFLTDSQSPLQLGMNFYRAGEVIKAHYHLKKHVQTDAVVHEFLLIAAGQALLRLYDAHDQSEFASRRLDAGDMVLLLAGGHGLDIQADTKIVELKLGPYDGKVKDKVVFGV